MVICMPKINFIIHFFLETLHLWQNFSQNPKKTLFWDHFEPLLPKFGQKWIFLGKRALSVFKYPNYPKNRKKRAIPYRKCWTDRWTDRQTDRQWWKNPLNDGGPKRPILHKTDNTVLYNSWLKMSLNKNFKRCVSILILCVLSTEVKIKCLIIPPLEYMLFVKICEGR